MPRLNQREPSAQQTEANRRNAQKSTGPRTPQGKQQVCLNALKHGLHADLFVQGMLALHEDPRAYYRLLGELLASLRPANPHQRLQVEDIARLRVEKQRLQRARAALIAGKMRGLERQRERRLLEFDCEAPDLPQAELLEKGLYRAPDSPPKFEKMLSCFDVLISVARQGEFGLDPEPELTLLYGQEPSLEGAYLRNVFRRFVAVQNHGVRGSGSGVREVYPHAEGDAAHLAPSPESRTPTPEGVEGEPERLLLLQTLFAAKRRALRLYQLYNREFVAITPDQRDGCFAPSDRADVNLMRQEAQNERQLRWALKVYWQTQKEDAARAAQPEGETRQADKLLQALEQTLTPSPSPTGKGEPGAFGISDIFDAKQSHQPIETTEEVSGIGQIKPNFGMTDGRLPIADLQVGWAAPPTLEDPSAIDNRKSSITGARPKVKELLEQMQSDPEARALVETFLLSQMVQEESQREEQELAAWQREREKREALEEGLEQMVAAQQELESRNRRLRAQVGGSELAHQQMREQVKPAEAAVAPRREPTPQEIYQKIGEVIGLAGPEEFFSDTEKEDLPPYHPREREYLEFPQEHSPAGEVEQRQDKEQDQKRLDNERMNERR